MVFFTVLLFFLCIHSQSTYYVTSVGSDSQSCGDQSSPCASINQVLINYPGTSCTISIDAGKYPTTTVTLQRDAVVVFQGTGNPIIIASWKSGSFLSITETCGFEFHDMSINLSDGGDSFVVLDNGSSNVVGFYNVNLSYSAFSGPFIYSFGSFVLISNMTFGNASLENNCFITNVIGINNSNITVTGSTFTNLTFLGTGGLVYFMSSGGSNLIVNSSTFDSINSNWEVISFNVDEGQLNQSVTITSNVFRHIYSYVSCVYIEAVSICVICISNSMFENISSDYYSGVLTVFGSQYDGESCTVSLNNLTFSNCSGDKGVVLVGFSSVNVTGLNFANNHGKTLANDFVHEIDSGEDFVCNITNSYSQSDLPKAVIFDQIAWTVTDISDQLPSPTAERVPTHSVRKSGLKLRRK